MKYSAILEKVKLRGDRQRMTLEELVLQYQAGDIAVFDTIYEKTETERETSAKWLRKALPSAVTMPEIYALFDDALLEAVQAFNPVHKCTFISFLRNILGNLRKDELDRVNAQKRSTEVPTISFQQEPEEGGALENIIEDSSVEPMFELVDGVDIIHLMQVYSDQSVKKRENAMLIIQDTMYFIDAEEKYNRMRSVLRTEATNTALRKKCQRAKADFRLFVEENKK